MWSGGKDSALALDRARRGGLEITRLVSLYDSSTRRVRFHATRVEMLEAQAAAIGIDLRAVPTAWAEMESTLLRELASLKAEDFTGVVFGDIHLADVRAWYEDRVRAAGLDHVEPIWGEAPQSLLNEFISTGGRAVLTCVELAKLDGSWLGRVTDGTFAIDIAGTEADPCGENGEYHSFAFEGPAFTHTVRWLAGERRIDAGFAQLDLTGGP